MSKGKDFRAPRKRGFDDDGPMPYEPRPRGSRGFGGGPDAGFGGPPAGGAAFGSPPPATGPTVDAVVKWFKADKGYGFVELSNGQGDAFLHANALHSSGHESVPSGAKLKVIVGAGAKGAQVTRVMEVDLAGVVERPARSFEGGGGGRAAAWVRRPRRAASAPRRARSVHRGLGQRPGQVVRRRQGFRLRGERRRRQGRVRAYLRARPVRHLASRGRPAGQYAGCRYAQGARGDFAVDLKSRRALFAPSCPDARTRAFV